MRPCPHATEPAEHHARKGEPYTPDQCRCCWNWLNRVECRLAWGGPRILGRRHSPCAHLGGTTGDAPCPSCGQPGKRIPLYACAVHGTTASLGGAPGHRSCIGCRDWQEPGGFAPKEGDPRCGVVIGSYRWPNLVALQIRLIRHTCGDVPILVSDDCTDGFGTEYTGRFAHLAHVTQEPGVTLWPNPSRIGHCGGDMAAFWKGLVWGKALGLEYVAKLSQRALLTRPRWLQDGARELAGAGLSLASQPCRGRENFPFRSELALLRVEGWSRPDVLARLTPRKIVADPKRPYGAEWTFWSVFQRLGEPMHPWGLFGEDRYRQYPGLVWHCSHGPAAYREVAAEFGVELDADFHCSGWQGDPAYVIG